MSITEILTQEIKICNLYYDFREQNATYTKSAINYNRKQSQLFDYLRHHNCLTGPNNSNVNTFLTVNTIKTCG